MSEYPYYPTPAAPRRTISIPGIIAAGMLFIAFASLFLNFCRDQSCFSYSYTLFKLYRPERFYAPIGYLFLLCAFPFAIIAIFKRMFAIPTIALSTLACIFMLCSVDRRILHMTNVGYYLFPCMILAVIIPCILSLVMKPKSTAVPSISVPSVPRVAASVAPVVPVAPAVPVAAAPAAPKAVTAPLNSIYCRTCGSCQEKGRKFCTVCGRPMNTVSAPVPTPAPAPAPVIFSPSTIPAYDTAPDYNSETGLLIDSDDMEPTCYADHIPAAPVAPPPVSVYPAYPDPTAASTEPIAVPGAKPMRNAVCPNCGARQVSGTTVCKYCGTPM